MFDYDKYLRKDRLPHIWCPGCGHGIVMKALLRAIERAGLDQDKTAVVSGIGCASRLPTYVDFDTLHTTHGRALAFATGLKLARPELNVIIVSGDGDACAIGGNHFIHTCRRNIDMTLVVMNNEIYGMTGGQRSPTTPLGDTTSTTVLGNIDAPFDISHLAIGAGASYVARTTTYHAVQLEKLIADGISHKGFSVIESLGACYTALGRRNRSRYRSNIEMLHQQREIAMPIKKAEGMDSEQLLLEHRITTGVLLNIDKPEYVSEHQRLLGLTGSA